MCDKFFIAACLLIGAHLVNSAAVSLPKCELDDLECAKSSAQMDIDLAKRITEWDIKAQPLFFEHLDASSDTFKLILNNITVTGLSDCIAEKIEHDPDHQKLFVKVICNVTLDGQYEMNGSVPVLPLPVQGDGDIHAAIKKIVIEIEADVVEKVGEDGKTHWDVKSWKNNYELKEKADLDLQNLIGGNEVSDRAKRDLLSLTSNAIDILAEVGPPIIKAIIAMILKTAESVFGKISLTDLFKKF